MPVIPISTFVNQDFSFYILYICLVIFYIHEANGNMSCFTYKYHIFEVISAKYQFRFLNSTENYQWKYNTHTSDFILMGLTDSEAIQKVLFMLFLLIYLITGLDNAGMMLIICLNFQIHSLMYFFPQPSVIP